MTDEPTTPAEVDDLEDLAAELDDADPGEAAETVLAADELPEPVFTSVCVGGPYNGRTVTSRYPRGFLLVDRPTSRAWLYDTTADVFTSRGAMAPMPLDDDGRWRAAEEDDYDVMAYEVDEVPA